MALGIHFTKRNGVWRIKSVMARLVVCDVILVPNLWHGMVSFKYEAGMTFLFCLG